MSGSGGRRLSIEVKTSGTASAKSVKIARSASA